MAQTINFKEDLKDDFFTLATEYRTYKKKLINIFVI